jgi:two-component system phosphate regulon sensor histidine kinase PhoR
MLKKIYLLIGSVLLISVFCTGMIAFNAISQFNRDTNEAKLQAAVNLISAELQAEKSYEEIAGMLSTMYDTQGESLRYTVIDLKGKVLYDNETDASLMENHLYRPEISTAIETRSVGQAIRESATQNIEVYYYARYQPGLDLVIRTAMPMVTYLEALNSIEVQFLVFFGIALLALILIGLLSAAFLTKPLTDLKKASIAMSGGNYKVRVVQRLDDKTEIGEVSRAFNTMAGKLETVVLELDDKNLEMNAILNSIGNSILVVDKNLNVTFMNRYTREEFVDQSYSEEKTYPLISIVHSREVENTANRVISDKKAEHAEMVINTRKGTKSFRVIALPMTSPKFGGAIITFQDVTQMQKLQQMRSEFVSNVTHELKTPLTSIRGFVDTLRQGAMKNPEVAERFLEIIDVEAERLYKLISDILSLSEIEEMKQDSDASVFDLNPLFDEVMVLLDDEAVAKHVTMITSEVEEISEPFMVKANRYRIKQILINLIENAIKYNVDNGKVYISAERSSTDEVVLKVRDTGYGIAKEHLPRIFERFYRVDKSRSKELGGTGLGLSIVKHIAMLYGGNASAESTVGQGSEFTVTLKI